MTAHAPAGDSPFGISDMAGNVWQSVTRSNRRSAVCRICMHCGWKCRGRYTSEINDGHTRSVIVRGGSNYRPSASHWYFPNRGGDGAGPPCSTHNKYFLMDDSYERAGTIGFRCVVDTDAA